MIGWDTFIYFAAAAIAFAIVSSVLSLLGRRKTSVSFAVASALVLASFIAGLWGSLGRPQLRTMGETRLWYFKYKAVG